MSRIAGEVVPDTGDPGSHGQALRLKMSSKERVVAVESTMGSILQLREGLESVFLGPPRVVLEPFYIHALHIPPFLDPS